METVTPWPFILPLYTQQRKRLHKAHAPPPPSVVSNSPRLALPHSRKPGRSRRPGLDSAFAYPIPGAMAITCAPAPSWPGPAHHTRTPTNPALAARSPEKLPRMRLRLRSGAGGRGGGMRLPGCGVAPQAGSPSGAEEARRCPGPWPGRPGGFPQPPKINFAAVFAAFSGPPSGGAVVRKEPSCVRASLLPWARAGPRRHGRHGAGAGRSAVRPAGGAARPGRSLLRGGVLLQGRAEDCCTRRGRGRVQVRRRPCLLGFAFPSSCSAAVLFRGEATWLLPRWGDLVAAWEPPLLRLQS